jgi:hypothetical protein
VIDTVGHLGRAEAAQLRLERAELLAAAVGEFLVDFRQPPRRAIQPRDVVARPGLLAGSPGPEPLCEFIELVHKSPISPPEGTFALLA